MTTKARIGVLWEYGNDSIDHRWDELSQWQRDAHPWTVELRYRRRKMRLEYWTGQAVGEPDPAGILESVWLDARSGDQCFQDWCGDLGYDTDSRTAERVWLACREQRAKLERLLGDDFDELIDLDEDELGDIARDANE